MKDLTKQLGYVKPSHNYELQVTAFPPIVNPNYLDFWAEFIHLTSTQELYNRYRDNKLSISQVALAFINYLHGKHLPNIFQRTPIDPIRLSYDFTKAQMMLALQPFKQWLDTKQFTRYFLISNRKLRVFYSDNTFLRLKIPDHFELSLEMVSKQPLEKVWSIFPANYWPNKPNKLDINFKAFCERRAGLSEFGEYKAAIITGNLLAIRVNIPITEILLGRVSNANLERKLNLAIKGNL
jgi:hypothetical protein